MSDINYDQIIEQLKSELNSDCAIANRYGIVLGSIIEEFSKGKIIPHKILELMATSNELADELNIDQINSFSLASQKYNYLFSFSENLILISRLGLNVNLGKLIPSIDVFIKDVEKKLVEKELNEFSSFDFSIEIEKIKGTLKEEEGKESKYSIIKELIKYISK